MTRKTLPRSALTFEEVRSVSPALEKYTLDVVAGNLWKRPDLSPRDRSIVTVSVLIARNQTIGMLHYFNLALDSGLKAGEISEIITHLAFYAGWSNAFSPSRSQKAFLRNAELAWISFRKWRPSSCRRIKLPRNVVPPPCRKARGQSRRDWCNSLARCCSKICGCVPGSRHGIAVWSRSAR